MTDKQIIIDYENLCENYSKEVGCYNTFDGNCIKEQCFTYRLLQLLQAKEQEFEELQMSKNEAGEIIAKLKAENEKLKQTLTEIKEICRFNFTITTTNLLAKTILQKINECEVENEN